MRVDLPSWLSALQQVAQTSDDAFWFLEVGTGRFTWVSPGFEALWGRTAHAVLAQPDAFFDAIHPDDRARMVLAHRTQAPTRFDEKVRLQRPDTSVCWVHVKGNPLPDAHGTLTHLWGQARSLGAHAEPAAPQVIKRCELDAARRELQESENRFRQMIDHVGQGIIVVQDACIIFANPRAEAITGYTLEQLRGFGSFDAIIHPDDRAAAQDRHHQRLAGVAVSPSYEFRIVAQDGTLHWLELGAALIAWSGRQATLTFFTDVTVRKQLEADLKATLAERETTLQHSIVGIAFLSPNGRLRWANDALARIFGVLDTRGESSLERYYPSREVYLQVGKQVSDAVMQGRMFETELPMRRADGTLFWAYLSGKAVNPHDLGQGTVWVLMDVNHQHTLEAQLKHQAAEQEAILQTSQIGIAHTVNRVHQWVNRAFADMVGFRTDELIGHGSRQHFPDDDTFGRLGEDAYPDMAQGKAYTCETRMKRKNGTVFWVQMRGKNIDAAHPERGAIWTVMDITETKMLDQALRQRTAEQDVLLQTCQIGLSLTRDRVIQWINRSFVDMLGFSAQELIGQSARLHFPSQASYEQFAVQVYPVLAQNGVVTCEWAMRAKSGATIWLDMRGKNIDPTDASQGTIWSVMDITPRKVMEDRLRATSSEREAILQSALVGITFSRARVHQWVNRTFARMMGYEPEELIGQPSRVHYVDDASWAQLGERAYPEFAVGRNFEAEWPMKRRDGSVFWVQLYGCSVELGHPERGTIWTFLDISRHKQAEADTLRALEQQKELNALKSRFVSMTSHEFRTPLATILSSTELLRYYSDRLPAQERQQVLGSIEASVRRMTHMLDDVLVIGKAEAQMLQFKPSALDVAALCHACAAEAAEAASAARKPDLQVVIDAGVGLHHADENLLRHVLVNLLSNAFKYSPTGGTVQFCVKPDGQDVVFEVVDQGIGIPEAELPRLFQSFHRADNVGNIQGTGLGLAIVKKSVDLHGGRIDVASQIGQGSRFTVRIPMPGMGA